jgi:hypothetical protein
MLAALCSAAWNGIEANPVEPEVNAGYGGTVAAGMWGKDASNALSIIIRKHAQP